MIMEIHKFLYKLGNKDIWKKLSIAAVFIYVFAAILFDSKYAFNTDMHILFPLMRGVCYLIVLSKGLLDLLNRRYTIREIFIGVFVSILLFIIAYESKIKNPLIYWIFILALHDTDYWKILKYSAIAHIFAIVVVVISAYSGIIENYYTMRSDQTIRWGLGFQYVSLSANYFFYFILIWVAYRREKISIIEILVFFLIQIFLFYKTDTKSAFIFGILALAGAAALKYIRPVKYWNKFYTAISVLLAPISAVSISFITYMYNPQNQILAALNNLVTGRLNLGKLGIEQFGISLFGKYIDWNAGTITDGSVYNYVDSSYIQILLNYGIVGLILVLTLLVIFGWLIYKKRDVWMLLSMSIVIAHSILDPQLIVIAYNSMLFIFAYAISLPEEDKYVLDTTNL